ncbi:MAG: hypothetical protein NT155_00760 [Candidatus Staskawiczbacteria bacterium]|nr:hypothetical protein [Candidatus Staskawiczbacteria bacterium]
MSKIAKKIGKKDITAINVMVSKKASKLGISAEAAFVILANSYGIGTSTYQKNLDDSKRAEIRDSIPIILNGANHTNSKKQNKNYRRITNNKLALKIVINNLIKDKELLSRCGDILMAHKHFDRPINQATQVLEDRVRDKSKPTSKLTGESLVGYAFNEDSAKTVLQVFSKDADDQRGFTQIMRGIVPAFRNKTHHHLVNSFTQEEALSVCGFIDVLLRVVDNSTKIK